MAVTLFYEGDNRLEEADAKTVLDILCEVYPMYPWAVSMRGGMFFIRHLGFPANWGMAVRFANVQHDAAVLKREVIMKTGEFLERANLKRGAATGEEIGRVEGVPEKWQPFAEKPDTYLFGGVMVSEAEALRTAPRPQVFQEMARDGD